jgi:hypothetical protein
MFAFIGSIINSVIGGVLSPLFTYLNKKQDVGLAEYQAMTSAEKDEYLAYVKALGDSNQAKIQANNWWGAHLMIYLFGLPAAVHWTAVYGVTTFPGYFHNWFGVDFIKALPDQYASAELTIALSFFILAPTLPFVSSVSQMLNRK